MSARAPRRLPSASRPQRLGSAYAKLWAAVSASDIGDGIYYTALPLLAATITRDPLQVATVEVAGRLPWLLLALPAMHWSTGRTDGASCG